MVANRIIEDDPVTHDFIEELAPGSSAQYSLKLPHDVLMIYIDQPAAAGVYSLGVQALGQTADGRDTPRTAARAAFIPLLPRQADQVRAALVMPIRHSVTYNRNGRLGGIRRWARDLAPGGRLDNLLDFAAASSAGRRHLADRPVSPRSRTPHRRRQPAAGPRPRQ